MVLVLAVLLSGALGADRVKTSSGKVEGSTVQGVRVFKGIPFAEPPVGDLRWKPPQPVKRWKGVRQADKFGPRCMQAPLFSDMVFRSDGMGEDCLYLSVWTPAKSARERLPVLVYIYGGGFQAGDSSEGRYDGEALARRGIVYVGINYRLGIFGFFSHPELTKESPHQASGNYGLMDQAAALAWVKKNIAAFGGDPARITIGGESAGSFSVSALMASPLSRGLIAGAIGESGAFFGRSLQALARARSEEAGMKFADGKSLADLRAIPADKVLESVAKPGAGRFGPNIDGYFFTEAPSATFAAGQQSRIPLLAGWNSDEGTPGVLHAKEKPSPENFIKRLEAAFPGRAAEAAKLYPASTAEEALQSAKDLAGDQFIAFSTWKWMELHTPAGKPVYRYLFTRARQMKPGTMINGVAASAYGATHSSEIEYALGNLGYNKVYVWAPEDHKVSEMMQNYWVNFVKTGNPNGPGLPEWPAATADNGNATMQLDVDAKAVKEQHRARYQFMDASSR
jgi:para-nitrobenzyl esterase